MFSTSAICFLILFWYCDNLHFFLIVLFFAITIDIIQFSKWNNVFNFYQNLLFPFIFQVFFVFGLEEAFSL